ncbi:cyclic pyranopterin monophosphate synthase MoaC [Campylobacter sp. VBCF_05 NA6]|uniref:cyclic pyranopterin monophosphate synthase MoaC n=1 Tax=unclassified Campylobacter TaxID=2593542 RepID=UPI0022E9E144|nr:MULTISPECIES: cyclic pyranopterin monophosphate synthase MoaC [unclassified Campylobacter]MDA3058210.1 cyclic pyranopterin monophosphate synthase MoaC [Campylobacter sp. VBCF_04 NA7]MDA3059781.1 cyclic pyranopterin monophosphate synthase MoaC [Campylobacter sp. VBCF_05 NA6]MDA3062944.1 cyclic pyranopterin monophosphate synthase MoaC [Campylobacter sp. JMF_14 EL1]MDA3074099.1 cyclic pyranopterin monophosphate synthase MoaC [Campylobacter sp. JMF_10 EL2]MDA3077019.1 cyclic pyranopterin monoph
MLTHIDENNMPRMVDVSAKDDTQRSATASGIIHLNEAAFRAVKEGDGKKGPVLQTAVVAAIMGAKKTSELIPMCHPLMINSVKTQIEELPNAFKLYVTVKITGKTGVEMEALTGVSVGLLAIYDMVKAVDKSMRISDIILERKEGGKSGVYVRE